MNKFVTYVIVGIMMAGFANAEVTEADLRDDQSNTTQIVTNGMGRHLQRYSPLTILNKDNVKIWCQHGPFHWGGSSAVRKPSR